MLRDLFGCRRPRSGSVDLGVFTLDGLLAEIRAISRIYADPRLVYTLIATSHTSAPCAAAMTGVNFPVGVNADLRAFDRVTPTCSMLLSSVNASRTDTLSVFVDCRIDRTIFAAMESSNATQSAFPAAERAPCDRRRQ